MYAKAKNACTCTRDGRESRNNNGNDNNDHDDNVREQDSPGRGRRGGGEIRAVNLGFPETKQPNDIWLCQFSEPVVRLAPSIDTDYVLLLADSHHERGTQWD